MVTKKQAEKVLRVLCAQRGVKLGDKEYGPQLVKDWEWGWTQSHTYRWAIIWEGGPYDWPFYFPYGGIEEEFGSNVPDVSERVNDVFVEAITSWAIAIYPPL
jgi:hypothetical protein